MHSSNMHMHTIVVLRNRHTDFELKAFIGKENYSRVQFYTVPNIGIPTMHMVHSHADHSLQTILFVSR